MGCVEEQWGKQTPRGSRGKSENPESNGAGTGRMISSIYHSWTMIRVHFDVSLTFQFLSLLLDVLLCTFISIQIILISMTIPALEIHHLYTLMAFSNALQQSTFRAVVCQESQFILMGVIMGRKMHLKHVAALITKKNQHTSSCSVSDGAFFRTSLCDKTLSAVLHEHCNL